ncbi:biotin synthase BioB [Clostridium aceticum]|uniref:Biotin synthase n=1 Tax=Clostridium aceticum TaxID=84022 RepID=A0A0D8IEV9_9CLOT|nr:biotin synthase BioB [Clostridium aceticum]AKL94808.1 biotin synthase BioB [Clostridium aceticum]KJF27746.1 biotin synthase [Clostridium aceticum]
MHHYITVLGEKILAGGQINYEEALALERVQGADLYFLSAYASKIREVYQGDRVDLCSIVSARIGGCKENCAFCSQSVHHETGTKVEVNFNKNEILKRAKTMEAAGVHRFDIVTSGKGYKLGDPEFAALLDIFKKLRKETKLQLCACLGVIGEAEARAIKDAGVTRYNHNLETAESFFPQVVSTHSYKEREKTLMAVKKVGMEVCCGGIIGMGETFAQRVEFAFALRDLGVDSTPLNVLNPILGTPLNVLNPILGTPLESKKPLSPLEVLKTIGMFRFVLPKTNIRFAGGREVNLRSLQALGLVSGINGMLTGNYLTTKGQGISEDLAMIEDLGLKY